MIDEIWKDIPGYEGIYQASDSGKVKVLSRIVYVSRSGYRTGSYSYVAPEKIMKPSIRTNYLCLTLTKDGQKYNHTVHRLIARTFLDNYSDALEVNHKDENKLNNCIDNLEMCTRIYNKNYGTGNIRSARHRSKPVQQLNKEGIIIREWNSINEACRQTGVSVKDIWRCCNNEKATAKGYKWRYKR